MLLNKKDLEILNLLLDGEPKTTTELAHLLVGNDARYSDVHKMDVLCRKHLHKLLRLGLVKKNDSEYNFDFSAVVKGKIENNKTFLKVRLNEITCFIPLTPDNP